MINKEISPSLMCMNLLEVKDQINKLNDLCNIYHFDVMDGSYVANFALSPDLLKKIRSISSNEIDVHVMVEKPQNYIELFAESGATSISIHADRITKDAFRVIDQIHKLGCKAGVALNPAEQIDMIENYIDRIDMVTIMTVDPGFAGQPFIKETLGKVQKLDELRKEKGYKYLIQLDGNCNEGSYPYVLNCAADILIVGNSGLFSLDYDIEKAWKIMQNNMEKVIGG